MPVRSRIDPLWATKIKSGMKIALLEMTTDIHRRSTVLAPKDSRALVNSGKIDPVTDGYKITYGSSRVPYARIHELGGWTGRGHKTFIKDKHYLGKAGDSVARGDKSKYFRGKV